MVTPSDPERGLTVTVPAGMGFPPVFYQQGSRAGEELRAFLIAKGYTTGYHWDYPAPGTAGASSEQVSGDAALPRRDRPYAYAIPLAIVLALVAGVVSVHFVHAMRGQKAHTDVTATTRSAVNEATERLLAGNNDESL